MPFYAICLYGHMAISPYDHKACNVANMGISRNSYKNAATFFQLGYLFSHYDIYNVITGENNLSLENCTKYLREAPPMAFVLVLDAGRHIECRLFWPRMPPTRGPAVLVPVVPLVLVGGGCCSWSARWSACTRAAPGSVPARAAGCLLVWS